MSLISITDTTCREDFRAIQLELLNQLEFKQAVWVIHNPLFSGEQGKGKKKQRAEKTCKYFSYFFFIG